MNISTNRLALTRLVALLLVLLPLLSACKKENDFQKEAREYEEKHKIIDEALIQGYFTRNGIASGSYTRLESGVYLITLAEGTGATIVAGQKVQTKYTARFLSQELNDVVFENTYDNRTLCKCVELIVDQSTSIIKGQHEALKTMKLGGRKKIFIPSYMAYGRGGYAQLGVLPDEPVWLDLEVTKVL
ncbi:FKBP-type peptidyl-prolyl cis-trans isomerase [Hymenobacter daecheongensis]|nr:FKBP-type peptidyl-prolyl cis-trans isomerase [Hymenobacter daecheongensis]